MPDQVEEATPSTILGLVGALVKGTPTAAALLIMFWMGGNFLQNVINQQDQISSQQAVFNQQQGQFNQQILKAVDEISHLMNDIHNDVGDVGEKCEKTR